MHGMEHIKLAQDNPDVGFEQSNGLSRIAKLCLYHLEDSQCIDMKLAN